LLERVTSARTESGAATKADPCEGTLGETGLPKRSLPSTLKEWPIQ
jgi:hypothetical protein